MWPIAITPIVYSCYARFYKEDFVMFCIFILFTCLNFCSLIFDSLVPFCSLAFYSLSFCSTAFLGLNWGSGTKAFTSYHFQCNSLICQSVPRGLVVHSLAIEPLKLKPIPFHTVKQTFHVWYTYSAKTSDKSCLNSRNCLERFTHSLSTFCDLIHRCSLPSYCDGPANFFAWTQ